MRCPTCAHDNLPGEDLCSECGMDLAGLDVRVWGVDPADPMLGMRLEKLPLKEALVLSPDDTVAAAVERMRERHEGCVFLEERGEGIVGVFTEHDVAVRVANRGRDPERTPLSEVMTPHPLTLQKDDPVSWALHRMGIDGFRHLAVMDGDRIRGFVSSRTLLKALLDS